uniref:glutathione transferase n=1 Tax=Leptobrachium leishanense TaxID=445787 RepID=A0A8C5QXD8_9ANUR
IIIQQSLKFWLRVVGRCEGIHILLVDQGAEWNEEVLIFDQWLKGDQKAKPVFGQLPGFQDGDLVFYQSNAIMRYLARKHVVRSPGEIPMHGFQNYEEGKVPAELKHFEHALHENNNGQNFIVGDKFLFADFNLVDLLHNHLMLAPECFKEFPLLSGYVKRISSRPKIKAFLSSKCLTRLALPTALYVRVPLSRPQISLSACRFM